MTERDQQFISDVQQAIADLQRTKSKWTYQIYEIENGKSKKRGTRYDDLDFLVETISDIQRKGNGVKVRIFKGNSGVEHINLTHKFDGDGSNPLSGTEILYSNESRIDEAEKRIYADLEKKELQEEIAELKTKLNAIYTENIEAKILLAKYQKRVRSLERQIETLENELESEEDGGIMGILESPTAKKVMGIGAMLLGHLAESKFKIEGASGLGATIGEELIKESEKSSEPKETTPPDPMDFYGESEDEEEDFSDEEIEDEEDLEAQAQKFIQPDPLAGFREDFDEEDEEDDDFENEEDTEE